MANEKMNFVSVFVAEILASTEKAFLCLLSNEKEVWIPKSVISFPQANKFVTGNLAFQMRIHDWYAEKEDLPLCPK